MSWGLGIVGALVGLAILGYIVEDKDSRDKRKAKIAKRKAERDRKKADKKSLPIKFEEAYKKHLKKKPKRTSVLYETWKDNDSLWRELNNMGLSKMPKYQQNLVKEMALTNLYLAKSTAEMYRRQISTPATNQKKDQKPLIDVKKLFKDSF
tara:strand:+ start:147 stop:599 length:453 start_codon:yes stop_codon:yes gene_type:complete